MVNKAVYHILSNDAELIALVNGVFPLVMPEETQAPCLVFTMEGGSVYYDKGGVVLDEDDVSVLMFAKSYPDVIDIAIAARTALEGARGDKNGIHVQSSRVSRKEEGYDIESDTYFQKITFKIKTIKTE